MGGMPHHVTKGPAFTVVDDILSGTRPEREAYLHALYTKAVVAEQLMNLGNASSHALGDWFGLEDGVQPPQSATNPTTGFWMGFYGSVQEILREAFIRAIEVSLGYEHDAAGYRAGQNPELIGKAVASKAAQPLIWPAVAHPRLWKISTLWICGISKFEGWISWQQCDDTERGGVVTLIFLTPGPVGGSAPLAQSLTDLPGMNPPGTLHTNKPNHTENPVAPTSARGLWVVGHDHYQTKVFPATSSTSTAEPTVVATGQDPIVVVRPSVADGGVL